MITLKHFQFQSEAKIRAHKTDWLQKKKKITFVIPFNHHNNMETKKE